MNDLTQLVGDLGGTNVRFGLCAQGSTDVQAIAKYSLRDYEDLNHVMRVYLDQQSVSVNACCLAIAGPIVDQSVKMTNTHWTFSADSIKQELGISQAHLINDFAAVAYSVAHLNDDELIAIGAEAKRGKGPITVFGPGTGLGAALLIPGEAGYDVIATEGGHAGLSARSDDELALFDYWRAKGSRITREFFISGAGIERIHESLCVASGSDNYQRYNVERIQKLGCASENSICQKSMEIFCELLGSAAGDQVLCTGSTGGLVLAGGVLPRFVDFLQSSGFRKRFESKGGMSGYTQTVSSHLIVAPQPGLVGAAAFLLRG
ncbi:MAG: glucokinase [Gammaproteobacteria bacterium]|nr:glucokinase [Gammaproteobacteria bacterium]MBT8149989.1 glucokinase [Gammaproteobacteria bacterium]